MPSFRPLNFDELPAHAWHTTVAIRFSHCDPAGIVYTPVYFDLFNGVIEDWYSHALQLRYGWLIGERRLGLGYAHASADFAAPSRMGDALEVAVIVTSVGRASVTLAVHAFKDRLEVVRATFVTVTTSLETHRTIAIPDDVRAAYDAYRERCAVSPEARSPGQ